MSNLDELQNRLLTGLTEPQQKAVRHTDGPLLVIAGPGSGKTRVITRRAAYLARTVASPWNILAITFTNKAASEMRERIEALGASRGMTVATFHALGAKLLRVHGERVGLSSDFTIFDRDDRRKVLKEAIEVAGYSTTNFSPANTERFISNLKNQLLTVTDFAARGGGFRERSLSKIYMVYEDLLRKQNALDFDDLLMRVALLLAEDEELRVQLEDRYRYVLIDEYQDTNEAQYRIAAFLTRERQNICATGDPDQSIYGWRGANIENILSFERDYPDATVVRLEQNYRSTKNILGVADALISHNKQRKVKSLWTENDEGPRVTVFEREDANEEANAVAEKISAYLEEGGSPREVAIFYRTNAMSRALEESLLKTGIRYQVARGLEFYARKEIKDVLGYLRVLVNPADEVALMRIINTPARGIGQTTVDRILQRAVQEGRKLIEIIMSEGDFSFLKRAAKKVTEFRDLLLSLKESLELPPGDALTRIVRESGLEAMYKGERTPDRDPLENIEELVNAAVEFQRDNPNAGIIEWLEHTALISDVDGVEDSASCVTLMTLHAAKGLEFPVVFIVGLEDGILPFEREFADSSDVSDFEEERRLLFVGITRAMKQLTLSYVKYRMRMGKSQRAARSRFLSELPHADVEWEGDGVANSGGVPFDINGELPADIAFWEVGSIVEHPVMGLGCVVGFHRGHRNTRVEVQFKSGERKPFILEFAPLTRRDYDEFE